MKCLLGMSLDELREVCNELSLPSFTAKQIASWLYDKKVCSIDQMTNLSKAAREKLNASYQVGRQEPLCEETSSDGTRKYLFPIDQRGEVETVFIPDRERATLCVSSQVGCKMNCLFCQTGKQGFQANLTSTEILNQIFSIEESDQLTNIVFMGMGEPLDNYDQVKKAIEILTSDWGLGWSPKRITVSSIGLIPALKRLLEETKVHVAISLHHAHPEGRKELMPVEKAYPIEQVIELLRATDFGGQRRLSFEYICFDNINDSIEDAQQLGRLIRGLDCRVNLIRFHAIPNVPLKTATEERMVQFRDYLNKKGFLCTIRTSRGEDIAAACGMLRSKRQKA